MTNRLEQAQRLLGKIRTRTTEDERLELLVEALDGASYEGAPLIYRELSSALMDLIEDDQDASTVVERVRKFAEELMERKDG